VNKLPDVRHCKARAVVFSLKINLKVFTIWGAISAKERKKINKNILDLVPRMGKLLKSY
jgi:hypothetical protein